MAAAPTIEGTAVSGVSTTSATLKAELNPGGKATEYHFEYGTADCASSVCTSTPPEEVGGSSPVQVKATVEGLTPGTIYHFRLVAQNGEGEAESPDRLFVIYSNPAEGLPDGRTHEQSSPTDKDGGDIQGDFSIVKASIDGSGISFGSTFGIPGGKGAQELPSYLASRGSGAWSTQGLLPPPSVGERAQVIGWLPDYSEVFSNAAKLGNPRTKAIVAQSTKTQALTLISPYTAEAEYSFAGTNPSASVVLFESRAKLPPKTGGVPNPAAIKGALNLYAWSRSSGELTLAGVLNDGSVPPKGAFAGPYDWARGTNPVTLTQGGGSRQYYLQEEHAITPAGDVYFTAGGTGQIYLRRNPTQPQSAMTTNGKGEEECSEEAKACTLHVSASKKDNGKGEGGTDSAGEQPAVFQAATADGSKAFFTSTEKLTNTSNTGPEQPLAAIGLGNSETGAIEDANFIPKRAVGVAVDSKSEYIYWADPAAGMIGRAKLNGLGKPTEVNNEFIVPGLVKFEVETEPGVFKTEEVPSAPRYVAVDAGHVYWTNTGRTEENGQPIDLGGTIGRADIEGTPASIEAAFIRGASDPQGIAVNATHIYWANAAKDPTKRSIGRAAIDGSAVDQEFFVRQSIFRGVALSPTHVYFSENDNASSNSAGFISRIPLEGGKEEFTFIGNTDLRGVAVDATNVYWVSQGEDAIGRIPLSDFPKFGPCENIVSCKREFIKPEGKLNGLAADATHLYWATNGEAPSNPGTDLYRYEPPTAGKEAVLSDLTVDAVEKNGAEVQGVVGVSNDASYIFFVANGVLDGAKEAMPGDCHGSFSSLVGNCNLYLWHEGQVSLIARLLGDGGEGSSDALNWAGTPHEAFGSAAYRPKTAFLANGGRTLLFRSQEQLTAYDNEGVPELYRFEVGDPAGIRCVSCNPSGEAAGSGPNLGSIIFPLTGPLASVMAVSDRNFSADGKRAFFETSEALSPADTNGVGGCPLVGFQSFPACLDVYEWEAPGAGSCKEGGPSYNPFNGGCLFLISSGKDKYPSLFADASASGEDVFFFTRQQLVGQDKDELQDVYDAKVGGGLASQNPVTVIPCESPEACHGPVPPAPSESSPGSAGFVGPINPKPKHPKPKPKKHKAKKKHHKAKGKGKKQKRANANGRAGR